MSGLASLTQNQTCFTTGDPLPALLRGRLRLSPWLGTIVGGLIINLPIMVLASLNNLWLDRDDLVGLSNDFGWWSLQLTLMPATLFFFLWTPDGIRGVLQGLTANRVIIIPESADATSDPFSKFIARFDQSYSHRTWIVASLIVALIFVGLLVPVHRGFKNWAVLNDLAFWYTEFFWFVMTYLVCLLVIRAAIVALWFNRLFHEFRISVKPLHRDGAGGLGPLGRFSVKVGYLIGIYGIAIAVIALTQSYLITRQFGSLVLTTPIVITLVAYLILSPLAFFAPISTAHVAMEKARREILTRIAEQLESDLAKVQTTLTLDAAELKTNLDKIEQLQRAHNLVAHFPVWPFNTGTLVRFFSSVLSPIAIAAAPTIGNLIAKFVR